MHFKVLSTPGNGILLSLRDIRVTFLPASVSVHGCVGATLGIEISGGWSFSWLIGRPVDRTSFFNEENPV